MNKPQLLSLLSGLGITVGLTLCTSPHQLTQQTTPAFENFDVPANKFVVTIEQPQEIRLESGTRIKIPAFAFVDANGNQIKDPVEIEYREFHSLGDIIASGIPMTYDSAGTSSHFVSAGMFEIDGKCNGSKVFIANDKQLEVNMASFQEGDNFNFYSLEASGNWKYEGRNDAEVNQEKQEKLAQLEPLPTRPIEPKEASEDDMVLDLDVNYSSFPELESFHGVMWQYAGIGKDPEENEWIFSRNWRNVDLKASNESEGIFKATFVSRDTTFTTSVRPVLKGESLEAAQKEFSELMASYNQSVAQQEAIAEQMAKEANICRSFAIKNFGTYNWDRVYKRPSTIHFAADFSFEGSLQNIKKENISIFLITEADNAVVRYPHGNWNMFNFDPSRENKIIAVLPGDKVAYISGKQFNRLRKQNVFKDGGQYTFEMDTWPEPLTSVDELDQVLARI